MYIDYKYIYLYVYIYLYMYIYIYIYIYTHIHTYTTHTYGWVRTQYFLIGGFDWLTQDDCEEGFTEES